MKLDTIKTRIENGKKALAKAEAKMARILKAQESNWENNPYGYYEGDIKYTQRDIDKARENLDKYQTMLQEELDKASSRNVPALVKFLDAWRDRSREWYNRKRNGKERAVAKELYTMAKNAYYDYDHESLHQKVELAKQIASELGVSQYSTEVDNDERYIKLSEEIKNHAKELKKEYENSWNYYNDCYGEIDEMESNVYYAVKVQELAKIEEQCKKEHKKFRSWDYHIELTDEQKDKAWNEHLEKILQEEWNRKYDRLLDDVIRITGTIDDATGLEVNAKGDLDGYIIGKNGTAKVNTFGAGGYNIQCFHYRTKITRVRK